LRYFPRFVQASEGNRVPNPLVNTGRQASRLQPPSSRRSLRLGEDFCRQAGDKCGLPGAASGYEGRFLPVIGENLAVEQRFLTLRQDLHSGGGDQERVFELR